MAAANARIAQTRAALYPDVTLTAHLGSESKALSDLFSGPATIWGFSAAVLQTVFNAGRTEAAIQGATARQEQALLAYEQALRQAFREMLDALVAQRQGREWHTAEFQRRDALRRVWELADLRHRHGLAVYLEVLDAQRNLYQSEQAVTDARLGLLVALVDLTSALGGGWSGEPDTP